MRYLLLAALVAAALGYVAYYVVVLDGFEQGFATWVSERRSEGLEADYAGIETHGFPFRVVATLNRPALAAPTAPAAPAWRAERLAIVVQPWNLRHLILDLSGRGRISAEGGDERHRLDYAVDEGRASYQVDADGRLGRLSVELAEVVLREAVDGLELFLARGQLHTRPAGEKAVELALRLEKLAVDPARLAPERRPLPAFGSEIALLAAELTVKDLPPAGGGPAAWLAEWRDSGGSLELRRFKLTWGEVDIEADGTLALDEALRPIGALTARVRGHAHLIDAATATGQMRERDAKTAKSVLDILAKAGGGVLSVPLTLQDGLVSLGPIPVARLAPLLPPGGQSPAPASPDRRQ